ncbi:MAG: flagellar hook-length control protein FliK [Lachnospiraceae bacterium]|nr:flagellar hook-length control protein FliK [Lachnospiraceae bacterium]
MFSDNILAGGFTGANISSKTGEFATGNIDPSNYATKIADNKYVPIGEMEVGSTFTGKITDIRGNEVTIDTGRGELHAKIAASVNININEVRQFEIRENSENRFLIAPLESESFSPETEAVYKALNALNLPATDKNIDVVFGLLNHQMGLNKQNVQMLLAASYKFPDMEIEDLIFMQKNQIPITEENVTHFLNYSNNSQTLSSEITQLSANLSNMIGELLQEGAKSQSISDNPVLMDFMKEVFSEQEMETLLSRGDSPDFTGQLKLLLEEHWAITPENFSKSTLQENIAKTLVDMESLTTFLKKSKEEFALSEEGVKQVFDGGKAVAGNLNFMNLINHTLPYFQIPLKFFDQVSNGEIYVFSQKRTLSAGDGVRLFLRLDMEHLGKTEVLLYLKDKNVSADFAMEREDAVETVKENMETLKNNLAKKGYVLTDTVRLKEEEDRSLFDTALSEEGDSFEVKRFTFDRRI